ncbi:class I SAM-dependent methyltransferase [Rhizobium sp. C1]|uniref:class I SAM-dependent methyltransferase n=1 Tax=Rhizobium sp. C1 TaxID=1349799 RepID=UPI001E3C5E35|nr:methyltransferase domain-containing protein [Rhizobium sp. C1]MCD2180362.1 class I SAM-dependent methyltransferase [Rhizobium sp. C1]
MFNISPVSQNNVFRRRRVARLNSMIADHVAAKGHCRLLDMGGTTGFWSVWRDLLDFEHLTITCVNLAEVQQTDTPGLPVIVRAGNACAMPEFEDNAFDIVFSNSVIEHVGLWPNKIAFAKEARRLAPSYMIQTPNFWFPIDPHSRFAFLHWLPRTVSYRVHMMMRTGFYPKTSDLDEAMRYAEDADMLDTRQMAHLFPDATIETERFMLLTKSLLAIRHSKL